MEIKSIEIKTFEAMKDCFNAFADKVDAICDRFDEGGLGSWLDNQDVCLMLNISQRTLQTLRNNGMLPYSYISRKMFYKLEDVEKIVGQSGLKQ